MLSFISEFSQVRRHESLGEISADSDAHIIAELSLLALQKRLSILLGPASRVQMLPLEFRDRSCLALQDGSLLLTPDSHALSAPLHRMLSTLLFHQ